MKEMIQASDYAGLIMDSLPRGILLNTQADKFNSMVIGWGHMGVIWGLPTFSVYVRQSRFTREQLDEYLKTEPYVVNNVWQDIRIDTCNVAIKDDVLISK